MARCKHCKQTFEQTFFLQKICSRDGCVQEAIKEALAKVDKNKKKEWREKKKKMKEALKPKQDYEKDLEVLVNSWVRLRDKDKPCISCGKAAGTYTMTAGHYYPAGTYKNIRFDLVNINGQCWWNCNKNQSGNLAEYRLGLIERVGMEEVLALDKRRLVPRRFTVPELKELIEEYKLKLK